MVFVGSISYFFGFVKFRLFGGRFGRFWRRAAAGEKKGGGENDTYSGNDTHSGESWNLPNFQLFCRFLENRAVFFDTMIRRINGMMKKQPIGAGAKREKPKKRLESLAAAAARSIPISREEMAKAVKQALCGITPPSGIAQKAG